MVYVASFGVRFSVMFQLMFVHYTFSSGLVAEWPTFGKQLSARLAVCSYCILYICNFLFISNFGFMRGILRFLLLQFLCIAFLLLLYQNSRIIF